MPSSVHALRQGVPESKSKTVRRHGACNPCKLSKTKCDGAAPCSACRSEKRKSRTCEYSDKAQRLAAVRQQIETERVADRSGVTIDIHNASHFPGVQNVGASIFPPDSPHHEFVMAGSDLGHAGLENCLMLRPIALCDVVDEFIQLKPPKGQAALAIRKFIGTKIDDDRGAEPSPLTSAERHNTSRNETMDDKLDRENRKDVDGKEKTGPYEACAVTFRSKLDLLKKAASDRHITYAWTELGRLVREVQATWSVQLRASGNFSADHRSWRQLLLDMLEFDCLLSFNLGYTSSFPRMQKSRLLSSILRPSPTDEPMYKIRLEILQTMHKVLDVDMFHQEGIVDFLQLARLFMKIKDTDKPTPVENIATCTTKEQPLAAQDLKIQANLLLIVVFCRTASVCDFFTQENKTEIDANESLSHLVETMDLKSTRQKSTLCRMVIKYSKFLLEAFARLCEADPDSTAKDWTRCQGALIAATLVGVARLREKNSDSETVTKHLISIEGLFRDLSDRNPNSTFLRNAADCIHGFQTVKAPANGSSISNQANSKPRTESGSISVESTPTLEKQTSKLGDGFRSPPKSRKRTIEDVDDESEDSPQGEKRLRNSVTAQTIFQLSNVHPEHSTASYMGIQPMNHPSLFEDNSANYHQSVDFSRATSLPSSANTSFAEADPGINAIAELPVAHPGPPYVFPWDYTTLHPPMVWNTGFIQESYTPEMRRPSNDFSYNSSPVSANPHSQKGTLDEGKVHVTTSSTFVKPTSPQAAVQSSVNLGLYAEGPSNVSEMSLTGNDKFFNMTAESFGENQSATTSRRDKKRAPDETSSPRHTSRRQSINDLRSPTVAWTDPQRRCSDDVLQPQHNVDSGFANLTFGQPGNIQTGHHFSFDSSSSSVPEHSAFQTMRHPQLWRRLSVDTGTHYA